MDNNKSGDYFENLRISGNNHNQIVGDGVGDLQTSNNEFNKLATELHNESHKFKETELTKESNDIELGERVDSAQEFELRKYFENSQRNQLDIGNRVKKMGVSIKDLTVVGQGADSSVILDSLTPIRSLISFFNPKNWKKKSSTFNILKDINGYIEDGKMLLVLGRPGAGCSTLLRVISNQRESYVDVTGDVLYGNISSKEWLRYRGEALYIPEEDIHHPTLTLHETLDFALKLKTPGNRLPDHLQKSTFREKIYNLLVSMYGLVNQRNTMIGNEYVRGLSGGERKRSSIAEAMVSASSIYCWDSSTRGLDSASAYDYAKSLRIMSDTLHKTTIASFYQASDSIYNLFDKVLVLDKGRCIYFGDTKLAKQYFLDLGFKCEERKSIPDFITGVTNPQERIIRDDFLVGNKKIPETSGDFEDAWRNSELYHKSLSDQEEYEKKVEKEQPSKDFIEQVLNEKSRTTSKKSPYSSSFIAQCIALSVRQIQLVWGDKFTITSKFLTVFVQSFIFGSIYFQMDDSTDGLFVRGGAVFSSVIFLCILTQGELFATFVGRRILQKHKSYALYRPSAYFLSQVIVDIPYSVLKVLLHSFIAYFMYGLDYNAGKFFIFIFTLIGVSLASGSLFRAFANFTPSMFIGQNVMNFVFIFMVNYFGYTITLDQMHPWFKWFIYVNPLGYAFKALMENEFKGLDFSCVDTAIPFGGNYTDSAYRVCPVAGSQPGELFVSGELYLEQTFSFDVSDRAFNVGMVYVLWIFYILLNVFAIEFFDWTSGGYTSKTYKKGKAPKLNDIEEEKLNNQIVKEATSKMKDTLSLKGGVFTWNSIRYTVPLQDGTNRLLLDDVVGWIKPGQMTALMGSSGAGKTTLLDVLAKRKTLGKVEGDSYLNGRSLEIDFERITGYVEQMDVFNPGLTVREALQFSARLRQEPETPESEKMDYVEHVLEMMEMKHLGDALIGSLENGIGISVEERKRLTIGLELVAKPHILFLDEPTSGLDSQSSYNIIKFIRKLADAGMPLVCTIHQPSSVLFEYFDRILLLAKGGKTVYFGDIGEKSQTLINYFQDNGGRTASSKENPAEYILDVIGAGVHGSTDIDWSLVWNNSKEFQNVKNELSQINLSNNNNNDKDKKIPREFSTGFSTQFIEVYKRLNLIYFRDPYYTLGTWFQMALSGLIVGFSFYQLKDSSSDMNQRIFFIWESLILGVLLIYMALPQFFIQKEYFKRDFASKYYSWHSFSIAIVLVEIPYIIVSTTIFFVCAYWTAGLESTAYAGFYYWLYFTIFAIEIVSFAQALAAFSFNLQISLAALPIMLIYLFLFCGVQVPEKSMPYFYRSWVYHLNPCKYFIEGVLTTVLKPIKVICTPQDLVPFKAPENMTCESYTEEFLTYAPGYVTTINESTNDCGYCIFSSGEEYYENALGFSYENQWRNFGILIAYWGFNVSLVLLFVFLNKKSRR